jgi:preprotein translocase subunit SecA
MAQKDLFKYAGDQVFSDQIAKLGLPLVLDQLRERIKAAAQGEAPVSPTQLMGELVGEKMQEEEFEDAEAAQAFALNFLALWNEAVAARPEGEATDAWRAQVQEQIEMEAKEARKPYLAPVKPGRNDPCSCGSGKKFKKCHGA